MAKLFRVAVVFIVAIVSITLVAVLFTAVSSSIPLPMISHTDGIAVVVGGVSERWLRLVFLLAVLFSVCFLYWRARRSR